MRRIFLAACAALSLVGCRDRDGSTDDEINPPTTGEAFAEVMIPPGGRVVSRSGSVDALQIEFRTPESREAVIRYYRDRLTREGWSLTSDLTDRDSVTNMLAERTETGQPMWVRVSRAGDETAVQLVGAVSGRDSTYVSNRQKAADTSNRLMPR